MEATQEGTTSLHDWIWLWKPGAAVGVIGAAALAWYYWIKPTLKLLSFQQALIAAGQLGNTMEAFLLLQSLKEELETTRPGSRSLPLDKDAVIFGICEMLHNVAAGCFRFVDTMNYAEECRRLHEASDPDSKYYVFELSCLYNLFAASDKEFGLECYHQIEERVQLVPWNVYMHRISLLAAAGETEEVTRLIHRFLEAQDTYGSSFIEMEEIIAGLSTTLLSSGLYGVCQKVLEVHLQVYELTESVYVGDPSSRPSRLSLWVCHVHQKKVEGDADGVLALLKKLMPELKKDPAFLRLAYAFCSSLLLKLGLRKEAEKLFKLLVRQSGPLCYCVNDLLVVHMCELIYHPKEGKPISAKGQGNWIDLKDLEIRFALILRSGCSAPKTCFLEVRFENPVDFSRPIIVEHHFDKEEVDKTHWRNVIIKSPPLQSGLKMGKIFRISILMYSDESKNDLIGEILQPIRCGITSRWMKEEDFHEIVSPEEQLVP